MNFEIRLKRLEQIFNNRTMPEGLKEDLEYLDKRTDVSEEIRKIVAEHYKRWWIYNKGKSPS